MQSSSTPSSKREYGVSYVILNPKGDEGCSAEGWVCGHIIDVGYRTYFTQAEADKAIDKMRKLFGPEDTKYDVVFRGAEPNASGKG